MSSAANRSVPVNQGIENKPPKVFKPKQIIYRELSFDKGSHYSHKDKPIKFDPALKIEDVVRDIIKNGPPKGDTDEDEDLPLSIPVRRDSYILLTTRNNAVFPYFSTERPAIDLAENPQNPPTGDLYGELRHYDRATDSFSATPPKDCQFAFFSVAAHQVNGYVQKINFNVVDARGTTHSIDPDVRYPGNGGG
jgi:hypothetical protein